MLGYSAEQISSKGVKLKLHRSLLLALLAVGACSDASHDAYGKGAVLHPEESIQATNRTGTVGISYVSPRKRRYRWESRSRTVEMVVRDQPFMDELGLYNAGSCWVVVVPLCRTPRLVVREAVHDFDSYERLYAYLSAENALVDWVYTSDGLAVGWDRSPDREQVNINLSQLTVHGQKPVGLRGARDRDIMLLHVIDDWELRPKFQLP